MMRGSPAQRIPKIHYRQKQVKPTGKGTPSVFRVRWGGGWLAAPLASSPPTGGDEARPSLGPCHQGHNSTGPLEEPGAAVGGPVGTEGPDLELGGVSDRAPGGDAAADGVVDGATANGASVNIGCGSGEGGGNREESSALLMITVGAQHL